jgi:hypothetical protein
MKRLLLTLLLLASPVAGQPTYDYRGVCPGFCGPAAIAFASGLDRLEVGRLMDWQHHHGTIGDLREDLQDSPAAHKIAILKAGLRYIPRTCGDILAGRATANKTVVLVHPDARSPYVGQHWCVLAGRTPVGYIRLHWGNGTIREFSPSDFAEIYARGAPCCAYEIVPGPAGKASWFNRAWDWLFKKIA